MALTTNTMAQAEGIVNIATGQLVTDSATAAAVAVAVGFAPRKVVLLNLTDRISYEWRSGMAANETLKTAAAGTRTDDTGDAAIVVSGSTVTFSATAVPASKTLFWEAIG